MKTIDRRGETTRPCPLCGGTGTFDGFVCGSGPGAFGYTVGRCPICSPGPAPGPGGAEDARSPRRRRGA